MTTPKSHLIAWLTIILATIAANNCLGQQMAGYRSYYNEVTKIPDSVIYTVTPHVKVADRLPSFHGGLERDYAGSGFDIGHNADADDLDYSLQSEYDSFNFINTFPQRPNCNRITWLALENYVRKLAAEYGSVSVKVYWDGIGGHIGVDNVLVPAYCLKRITYNGITEVYKVPNTNDVNKLTFDKYKITGE